jgi:hypothetical protein
MTDISFTLNDGTEYFPPDQLIENLRAAYPAISVDQELLRIKAWCGGNHKNRKTFAGAPRFITAWMAKAHDRGGAAPKFGGQPERPQQRYMESNEYRHLMAGDRIMTALLNKGEPEEPGNFEINLRRAAERIIADLSKDEWSCDRAFHSACHGLMYAGIRARWTELHSTSKETRI